MAYDDDVTRDDVITNPDEALGTDDTDPTAEDLVALEMETEEDQPLLADELEAIKEDRLSEPDTFGGPNDPSDNVDDSNWEEVEMRRGAGDILAGEDGEEDLESLGFHEERFDGVVSDDAV